MTHELAKRLLSESEEFLAEFQAEAEKGNAVDMTEFENKVEEFCRVLKEMPAEEAKKYEQDF